MHWARSNRYRRELLSTARRCVAAGWPVLPGAWWSPIKRRHVCDIPTCLAAGPHPSVGPIPQDTDLAVYALCHEEAVVDAWSRHPYSILIPTGIVCDVVEVPDSAAARLLPALRRAHLVGPIARHQSQRFIFTTTGSRLDVTDPWFGHNRVIPHGRGSWVTMPPSLLDGRRVEWLIPPPPRPPWRLPDRDGVLEVLTAAVS